MEAGLVLFIHIAKTKLLIISRNRFSILYLDLVPAPELVNRSDVPETLNVYEVMKKNADIGVEHFEDAIRARISEPILRYIGTE